MEPLSHFLMERTEFARQIPTISIVIKILAKPFILQKAIEERNTQLP